MIKGVIVVWTDIRHVTIDDSMINYMKIAILYVLYMLVKPIKYGIKVFAIFCSLSTILICLKL